MAETAGKSVFPELGIELVIDLLLFAFPYGAEQMNLPHIFWLGLACWVVGIAIAIRMFWIFPAWKQRLTNLEKGLIAFIAVGLFAMAVYRPVTAAYEKRNEEASGNPQTEPLHIASAPSAPTPSSNAPSLSREPPKTLKPKEPVPPMVPARQPSTAAPAPSGIPQQTINAPYGIAIGGGQVENPTVNNFERPYRHLTDTQKTSLKNLADSLPADSSFLHIEIVNDPEALKYGNDIADFFRSKTKTIGVGLSYPRGMPEGVAVLIDSGQEPLFPTAQKIATTFAQAGIPVIFTKFEQPKPGQIWIMIGVRPEH